MALRGCARFIYTVYAMILAINFDFLLMARAPQFFAFANINQQIAEESRLALSYCRATLTVDAANPTNGNSYRLEQ